MNSSLHSYGKAWLYRQPQLREERAAPPVTPPCPAEVLSPPSGPLRSLRQQVHSYRDEIARLQAENRSLKDQLARQLGVIRAASVTKRS